MIYTINVTQDHIDNGQRESAFRCPLALAIKESLNIKYIPNEINGKAHYPVGVTHQYFRIYDTLSNFQEYELPEKVYDFVIKFDRNEEVQPFSFEMEI